MERLDRTLIPPNENWVALPIFLTRTVLIVFGLLTIAPSALSAGSYASLSSSSTISDCAGSAGDYSGVLYNTPSTSTSKQLSRACAGGGVATDTANGSATFGSLGGYASSARTGYSSIYDANAQVTARFYDVFTYTPGPLAQSGDPIDIDFNLMLSGGFAGYGGNSYHASVSFQLVINSGTPLYQQYSLYPSDNGTPYPYPGNTALPWHYHTHVGQNSNMFSVQATLEVFTQASNASAVTASYGSTATLYIDLGTSVPAGTTLSSDSGFSYSQASEAVPEAGGAALATLGLAGLALLRRKPR